MVTKAGGHYAADMSVQDRTAAAPSFDVSAKCESQTVRDVMLSRPKTLEAAQASVGDVRALLENPHVRTALLVDGTRYAGAIERGEIPLDVPDDAPARPFASRDAARIEPDASISDALERLEASGGRRLVVVGADGETLHGLLCLKRSRQGFCTDRSG